MASNDGPSDPNEPARTPAQWHDVLSDPELGSENADRWFRAILAALPDLLFVVSSTYVFREYHAPNRDKLLVPPGAFVGKTLDDVLPADVASKVHAAVDETLEHGGSRTVEYSLDLTVGGTQWFEARSAVFGPDSVIFVVRDRTRQMLTEQKLRTADRMASVGALAAGVAHEINNPLTYVLGNLDLIRQGLSPALNAQPDLMVAIDDAIHGAQRVHKLVEDLRMLSHPGVSRAVPVDLHEIVETAVRIANHQILHRARLVRDFGDIPHVLGDRSQLGQVVLNLIVNAAQAIPLGHSTEHEIRISSRLDGDSVVLSVADTGAGLPEGLERSIFDPFVTTKPAGEGTGLGLAICHNIVRTLGGTITAHRRTPRGSELRVTLPVEINATPAEPTPPAPRDTAASRARLLLIDDDSRVAAIAARALHSHEVTIRDDSVAALAELLEGLEVDLIVCDLVMPHLSGMELYRQVVAARPELTQRFAFITGAAFSQDARAFVESTSVPLLQKPFDLETLRAFVSDRLEQLTL